MSKQGVTTYVDLRDALIRECIPQSEIESVLDQLLSAGTEIPRDADADILDTELTGGEVALVRAALTNGGDAVDVRDIKRALRDAGIDFTQSGRGGVRVGCLGMSPATDEGGDWCFGVDTLTDSDRYEYFERLADAVVYAKKFA